MATSEDEIEPPEAKKPKIEAFSAERFAESKPQGELTFSSATSHSTDCSYNVNPLRRFYKPGLGLNVDYYPKFFSAARANTLFRQLEEQLSPYYAASRNEVKVFGKVHKIPRKQTAFGDSGLSYNFSGTSVPANSWTPLMSSIRRSVETALGETRFNFVLVNRYGDGNDHMGEHRDDESDLIRGAPIASLTFGQARDFVFKHKDARGKKASRKDISPVTVCLEHGSLLVMNL